MIKANEQAALDERVTRLRRFHEQDPANIPLLCDLVDALLANGQIDSAAAEAENGLEQNAGSAELQFRLATCALAGRDYARAESLLADLMSRGHDGIPFRYNRAWALLWLGKTDESHDMLASIQSQWREYPPIKLLLARLSHLRGELQHGIAAVRDFLEAQPGSAEGLGVLALLSYDADDWQSARAAAAAALQAAPRQFEAQITQASLLLAENDSTGARGIVEQLVKQHPESGRAWSLYAQADMLDADLASAEGHLKQAIERMPNHIGTWHLLAWLQLLDGRLAEARDSLAKALELDRNFGETHGTMAVVSALEGDIDSARDQIKRARRVGTNGFAALYAESVVLERTGDLEAARKIIDGILDAPSTISNKSFRQLIQDSLHRRTARG